MTKHKPVSFSLGKPWRPFAELLYKRCSTQLKPGFKSELIDILNESGDSTLKSFRRLCSAVGG